MTVAALALGMGLGCGGELEPTDDDVSTTEQAMAMFCKPCLEPPCVPCYKYPPLPQPVCGDGWINPVDEDCDGSALAGQTCQSLGFAGGTLACSSSCTFDTSGCFYCGNGVVEGNEACDGSALAGQTCQSLGFSGGALACTSSCTLDTSACTTCGDGVVEGSEACDGGTCCRDDCTVDKQCQFLTSLAQALEELEDMDPYYGPTYDPNGYSVLP
jgi:hypothetical protein